MDDRRRTRSEERAAQSRYSAALDVTAARLTDLLGVVVRPTDAASSAAVQLAVGAVGEQERSEQVWHRTWGAGRRAEMLETTTQLGVASQSQRALLIWGGSPPLGFSVELGTALRVLPGHMGPDPERSIHDGFGDDLLLVGDNGRSGVRLRYEHGGSADQYDLRCWGRYAGPLPGSPESAGGSDE